MQYICKQCGKELVDKEYTNRKYCSYGCYHMFMRENKDIVPGSFKKGHINYKKNCSQVEKEKISNTLKEKYANDEKYKRERELVVQKRKSTIKSKYNSGELVVWNKGLTKETNAKIAEGSAKSAKTHHDKYVSGELIPPNKGKHHSDDTKAKMSAKKKAWWNSLTDVEREEKIYNLVCRQEPNYVETLFTNFVYEYSLPYIYVGNMRNKKVCIGRKTPDFIWEDGKKIIEIWGEFWHSGQNPQDRIYHFKKYGYSTLVVWAKELRDKDIVMAKVITFTGGVL